MHGGIYSVFILVGVSFEMSTVRKELLSRDQAFRHGLLYDINENTFEYIGAIEATNAVLAESRSVNDVLC